MQKLIAVLAALLLASASGAPPAPHGSDKIIGGTAATVGEFPYVVAVLRQLQQRCSGFIYNEQ